MLRSSALNLSSFASDGLIDPWLEWAKHTTDHNSVLVILPGPGFSIDQATLLAKELEDNFKILIYSGPLPSSTKVFDCAHQLTQQLAVKGIKRLTIFACGAACNIAQAIALESHGNVRRLALLNPQSRMSPGFFSKLLDKIESLLPLGLPLRVLNNDFDSRPFLHRLRCPILIISSADASIFLKHQAEEMHKRIPNALIGYLKNSISSIHSPHCSALAEISCLVNDLLQRPVKRPQKNL